MKVFRDEKSKWYIFKKDFKLDFFFFYCFGFVFIFSVDVCEKMYNVLFFIFFFWVDDYYIIGVLVKVINVK